MRRRRVIALSEHCRKAMPLSIYDKTLSDHKICGAVNTLDLSLANVDALRRTTKQSGTRLAPLDEPT